MNDNAIPSPELTSESYHLIGMREAILQLPVIKTRSDVDYTFVHAPVGEIVDAARRTLAINALSGSNESVVRTILESKERPQTHNMNLHIDVIYPLPLSDLVRRSGLGSVSKCEKDITDGDLLELLRNEGLRVSITSSRQILCLDRQGTDVFVQPLNHEFGLPTQNQRQPELFEVGIERFFANKSAQCLKNLGKSNHMTVICPNRGAYLSIAHGHDSNRYYDSEVVFGSAVIYAAHRHMGLGNSVLLVLSPYYDPNPNIPPYYIFHKNLVTNE